MSPSLVLGTSVALQAAACVVGMRQILVSRRMWLWLGVSMTLIAVTLGRTLTLYQWATDELLEPLNLVAETVTLTVSALVLVALVFIARKSRPRQAFEGVELDLDTLKKAYSVARLGLWSWDAKSNQITCSRELRTLWGDTTAPASLTSSSFLARVYPDDRDIVRAAIARTIAGAGPYDAEYRIQWPNGSIRWLADRGEAIRSNGGQVSHMYCVAQDVTARKLAELDIGDQEQRLSLAITAAGLGVWDWDTTTNKTIYSPIWKSNLGYSNHQIDELFSEWESRIHPDDRDRVMASLAKFADDQQTTLQFKQRLLHQDGTYRWFLTRATAIREGQLIVRIVGCHLELDETNTDITAPDSSVLVDTPAAADTVTDFSKLAEPILQLALAANTDAAVITNAQGQIYHINQKFEQLLEISQRKATGQDLMTLGHFFEEVYRQPVTDLIRHCLHGSQDSDSETKLLLVRRSGQEIKLSARAHAVADASGLVSHVLLTLRECSERVEPDRGPTTTGNQSRDSLTDLADRAAFERRLRRLLATTEPLLPRAILHIDLDELATINAECGQIGGDALIRHIALLLQDRLRTRDTLGRIGGDEFGVLLEHCPPEEALRIAEQLRVAIQESNFVWQDRSFTVTASVGMLPLPNDGQGWLKVLSSAEHACNIAKQHGKNQVHVLTLDTDEFEPATRDLKWLPRIQQALTENRFRLFVQPVRAAASQAPGFEYGEVLLRMIDTDGRMVAPSAFIAAAERYEQMLAIDRWVLQNTLAACRLSRHADLGIDVIAVNISGQSLGNREFHRYVMQQLMLNELSPSQLCFEITETAAISNMACAIQFMSELKAQGCRFALDDFGSGLSSFGYLKSLPVDYLKIDGHFVRDMGTSATNEAMVTAMHNLGQALGIRTIAESVENDETLRKLAAIGVNYVQGHHIEPPRPLSLDIAIANVRSTLP